MRLPHFCLMLIASAISAEAVNAAGITAACSLPDGTTDQKLAAAYDMLNKTRSALDADVAWYNATCTKGVGKKSKEFARCSDIKARWSKYDEARLRYEQDRAKSIRAMELTSVERRLATTRAALKKNAMRAGQLDKDIEEWIALQEQSRREADQAILTLGKDYLFDRLEDISARLPSAIDEAKLHAARWPSIGNPRLQKLRAEALARLKDAKDAQALFVALKTFDTTLTADDALLSPQDKAKWAEFAIGVLSLFLKDSVGKLVVHDAKIGSAALYGWAVALSARDRYKEIAAIGENQYKEATRFAALYEKDLKAKGELQKKALKVGPPCS